MTARRPAFRRGSKLASSSIKRSALLRGVLVGAGALIGLCATAPDASAQYGFTISRDLFDDGPLIPPRAVAYRLQSRGFTDLSRPRFDGTAYIIDATNPVGARVRLFVDAQDGAIIGRRPLDVPYYPSAREGRPAPGYGWTEEDVSRRRTRSGEGLVPPADIPNGAPARPPKQAALGAAAPDANPQGGNPDGKGRSASTAKKTARLNQPQKPAATNTVPAAPAPKIEAAETAKPELAKPETTKSETVEPKQETAATPPKAEPASSTPAADQEASERAAAESLKAEKANQEPAKQEPTKQEPAKQDQAWRDPTPEESKRKIRVIDGATVVPGSGDAAPATTN